MSNSRLLLADDSMTIQKVVNLTFAEEGYEVFAASDGDSALAKIYEHAPDLILADVNMPGLSGYQLCERVKSSGELGDTPVILLVGSFEPFDEIEARRVGADDVLTKPFHSIRELVSKVNSLLASKRRVGNDEAVGTQFAAGMAGFRESEFSEAEGFEPDETIAESSFEEYTDTADAPLELFDEDSVFAEDSSETQLTRIYDEYETEDILSTQRDFAESQAETDYVPMTDSGSEINSEELPGTSDFAKEMGFEQPYSEEKPTSPETSQEFEFASNQVEESDDLLQLPDLELEDYSDDEFEASDSEAGLPFEDEEVAQTYYEETRTEEVPSSPNLPAAHFAAYAQSDELDDQQISVTSSKETKTAVADLLAGEYPPEMIDAIAKRVIERMSDEVVREIAWEVVPPLAESAVEKMARKKLEE